MSGLLERAAGFVIAPAPGAAATQVAVARAIESPRAAALGPAADVPAVAAATALALRRAAGAGAACVACWIPAWVPERASAEGESASAEAPRGASLAVPAASRLASRLDAHGFEAMARGRLARVVLPGDPVAAAAAWERLDGRIEAPAVLALGAARHPAFEPALARTGRVVLVVARDAEPGVTELAKASFDGASDVGVCHPLPLPARLAALAGLGGPAPTAFAPTPAKA